MLLSFAQIYPKLRHAINILFLVAQHVPTLEKLMNRLNELHSLTLLVLPASAVELPTYLFLRNGVYKTKVYKPINYSGCWAIKTPCVTGTDHILVNKKLGYIIFSKKKSIK
jgi:hypothetical protein